MHTQKDSRSLQSLRYELVTQNVRGIAATAFAKRLMHAFTKRFPYSIVAVEEAQGLHRLSIAKLCGKRTPLLFGHRSDHCRNVLNVMLSVCSAHKLQQVTYFRKICTRYNIFRDNLVGRSRNTNCKAPRPDGRNHLQISIQIVDGILHLKSPCWWSW